MFTTATIYSLVAVFATVFLVLFGLLFLRRPRFSDTPEGFAIAQQECYARLAEDWNRERVAHEHAMALFVTTVQVGAQQVAAEAIADVNSRFKPLLDKYSAISKELPAEILK